MPDDSAFFEIAAGLLPALMLAGILSDKLTPPDEPREAPAWPFWIILLSGTFFVLAEVAAIRAAISGEPTSFDRVVVSAALVAAAAGAVLLLLLPWIQNLDRTSRYFHLGAVVLLLVFLAVSSVLILDKAIGTASLREDLEEFERDADQHSREGDRLIAEQETLYARRARLDRELSRLLLRKAAIVEAPPDSGRSARLFFISQEIRSVRRQLDDQNRQERHYFRTFEEWARESEQLYGGE